MITDTDKFLVTDNISIKEAMRQMNKAGERILYVINNDKQLIGSLTDGDIRRCVLAGDNLSTKIANVFNKEPVVVKEGYDIEQIKQMMLIKKIESIPVVSPDSVVREILIWDEVFEKEGSIPKGTIDLPVVIMAGGKGTRLDPFTRVLPKPLVPIGDKTIIEIIMDKFGQYGVKDVYLSINHKSRMIKAYFEEINTNFNINYIEETHPLGTIGSLEALTNRVDDSVFVSNCDIIIEADYQEMVSFHNSSNYDITIVGSFRHFTIPYGICHIEDGGKLVEIQEKPEHDYLVNTGMYLIRNNVLNLIPKDQHFDITDLIKEVQKNGGSVGVFPLDENSWIDVGQWEEFRRATKLLDLDRG